MKSKIWWPRMLREFKFMIKLWLVSCFVFAVLGLLGASPSLVSDWIFQTGQEMIRTYNSSAQLIETVDNRNKGRRQYGALTVDGALYANSTINATGAINLGADVSLSRSAANVLNTPDSIIGQATGTIYGNLILGNENTKKIAFDGKDNYRILNVVSYNSAGTSITNKMAKITLPVITSPYLMFTLTVRGYRYAAGVWEAEIGVYTYNDGNYDVGCVCYTKGYCPFNIVKLGNDGGHPVVILGSTTSVFGDTAITADIVTYYAFYPELVAWLGDYTLDFVADISGVSDITTITAQYLPNINSNGLVVGTNKLSLTSGYVLDVSGAAYVSGTIYGAGTISGGTLVDRTDASKENALEDVRKWKVVGETIDHDSLGDCAVDLKEVKTGFEIRDKAGKLYNSISDKPLDATMPYTWGLKEEIDKVKEGIETVSADVSVRVVTAVVESKGRNISKTISTLSRAIQQLSERLDQLEKDSHVHEPVPNIDPGFYITPADAVGGATTINFK